ncbi:hypothetical protein [Azospirillum doebereinerae]
MKTPSWNARIGRPRGADGRQPFRSAFVRCRGQESGGCRRAGRAPRRSGAKGGPRARGPDGKRVDPLWSTDVFS